MSDSGPEKANVVQSRLAWEPGDITRVSPGELVPHPKNEEVYGDTSDVDDLESTFVESVAEKGVLEPVVITADKTLISGHRRWLAAQANGLDTIPARVSEFESGLAEREAVIEFNRQREKTPGQIINEFEEMLEIEQERARERNSKTAGPDPSKETFPDTDKGQARDKAAEKINADVSGRTLEKGLKVKQKAESDDTPDEVREVAKEQKEKLDRGESSFHRAHKAVEKAEAELEVEEQQQSEYETQPTVKKQDAVTFLSETDAADLLIADPPYTTDVDDIEAFANEWVPPAIDTITDGGIGFIFIGAYFDELQAYLNQLEACGVRDRTQVLVWTYRNTLGQTPNARYKLNWQAILFIQSDPARELDSPKTSEQWAVQDVNAPDGRFGDRHHKWQKPDELIERFIRHSTDEGETVIDPFVGTGTTVLKAAELGRDAIGCDHSDEMLSIAVERGCIRHE